MMGLEWLVASMPGPQGSGLGKPGLAGCPTLWQGEALPCFRGHPGDATSWLEKPFVTYIS